MIETVPDAVSEAWLGAAKANTAAAMAAAEQSTVRMFT
jgi:hypothetical protein